MFTCEIERSGGTPMYLQLYGEIKKLILEGRIGGGEKLPSKRALAKHLNLSVITVQNAYEQLLAEGYITSREKSGYFALTLQAPPPRRKAPPRPPLEAARPAPHSTGFPFGTWARLMRNVLMDGGESLLSPIHFSGALELRSAISEYLYAYKGMEVPPDQIVVGAGTEYLYGLILQLLGREKTYCLENPGYRKIGRIYEAQGVSYVPVPIDSMGFSAAAFQYSSAQIIHLSPAHHYPTGIVMPIARRQELLSLVSARDGYLIEDDYDSEFRFRGKPIPPIYSIDTGGRVIYMNTFTKTLAPSIRISYMILPPGLMAEFREKLGFYSCTVPAFEQYTLARFIREGYFERHISRTRKRLRAKRDAALRFFAQEEGVEIFEEDAGVHFLIRTKKDTGELAARANAVGMSITDIGAYLFSPLEEYENCYVVSYEFLDLSRETHPGASLPESPP